MSNSQQSSRWILPVFRRSAGFAVLGGLATALMGAILHGSISAILSLLTAVIFDWGGFSFNTGNFIIGALVCWLPGALAFAIAATLIPSSRGIEIFRRLLRSVWLSMTVGVVLGAIGGVSLGALQLARVAFSGGATSPDVLRFFGITMFSKSAYFGALLLMVIGIAWGIYRGIKQAREQLTAS